VSHQQDFADIYRRTQTQLWEMLGLAIVASFGIALFAGRYAGRLERRVLDQHRRDLELQRELRDLSVRLTRAREQERRVIARELHDDIGQMLSAIRVELSLADRGLVETHRASDALDRVGPIVDRALKAVRDLSHLLHPSVLDDLGLVPAINWFLKDLRRRHAIDIEFLHDDPMTRLSSEVESAAFRIVQESTSNTIKHGRATRITVSLRLETELVLTVVDNGVGFDAGGADRGSEPRGLGLISMRERAVQAAGSFVVATTPGAGTQIIARLPATRPSAVSTELDEGPMEVLGGKP